MQKGGTHEVGRFLIALAPPSRSDFKWGAIPKGKQPTYI